MIGYIDYLTGTQLNGWAYDVDAASSRLVVEIYSASELVGLATADSFRADLGAAGVGDGYHAFSCDIGANADAPHLLRAVVQGSDYALVNKLHECEARHLETFTQSTLWGIPRFPFGFSKSCCSEEADLRAAEDIIRFCRNEDLSYADETIAGSMWQTLILQDQVELRSVIADGDAGALARLLRASPSSTISNGLLQGRDAYLQLIGSSDAGLGHAAAQHVDALLALAQSVSLLSLESPEQGDGDNNLTTCNPAKILAEIERASGVDLEPPAVFDDLFGVCLRDRIFTRRHFQAADALLALRGCVGDLSGASICEIGGGAGLLAFYAARHGVRRYTLIDLPGAAFQQYFMLKRSLPDRVVTLGVDPQADIQVLLDKTFAKSDVRSFDCVVNIDSFPEMGEVVCKRYFDLIADKTTALLSINQENGAPLTPDRRGPRQVIVAKVLLEDVRYRLKYRFRNWVRKGYSQELYEIANV